VQGYLEALARGDAEAALSFAEPPSDKTFLTDEILKKQLEKYPITNIKVLSDVPGSNGNAEVNVVASFGDAKSDETIVLSKPAEGQGWKLDQGAVEVNLGKDSSIQNPKLADVVTLFGKPAPKSGKAYLFPGWVDFGSSNPNIDVHRFLNKTDPPSLRELAWGTASDQRPEFEVSDAGRKAIRAQLKAIVDECVKSNKVEPPNCPQRAVGDWFIDGTAQWTATSSVDDEIDMPFLDMTTATVKFWGSVEFAFKVQTTSRTIPVYDGTTSGSFNGEADVLQNPPKITLEKFR
jgi:hypothetical protein